MNNFDYLIKYIIVGDVSVGKSNILLKYVYNKFNDFYSPTIGAEFGFKKVQIDGKIFNVQIWDTAGQEAFHSIIRSYYKCSACAIIVYDVTNRSSFESIKTWIEDCRTLCHSKTNIFLVANKIDLHSQRVVTKEEGQNLAEENDIKFYEVSAKTGKNLQKMFDEILRDIKTKIEEGYFNLKDETCGVKVGNLVNISNKTKTVGNMQLSAERIKRDNDKNGCGGC